jgi:hypothetical protein
MWVDWPEAMRVPSLEMARQLTTFVWPWRKRCFLGLAISPTTTVEPRE